MTKKNILSLILVLILSFLYIILLNEEYIHGLNTIMFMLGVIPILVGIQNSFHYVNLSLGKTRKQISNEYVKGLIYSILLGIIYLSIINLFAFFVYDSKDFEYKIVSLETISIYSATILFSTLSMFASNIFYAFKKNHKNIIFILLLILIFSLSIAYNVFIYIKTLYLIAIIINTILFISLSIINKKIIMCKKM